MSNRSRPLNEIKKINNETLTLNQKEKKVKKEKGEYMKNVSRKILTVGLGLMATTYTASAAGTLAGEQIDNSASVDFTVGGVNQTDVNSNTVSFLVDRLVQFSVAVNATPENVIPGQSAEVLAYTVSHTGNYTGDFALAASNDAGDDFNPSSSSVFVEDGTTVGYQSGEDTATHIDELAPDTSKIVYIVSAIPSGLNNNDDAIVYLTATAHGSGVGLAAALVDNTADADVAGTVQNVFNDGDGPSAVDADKDGKHSDDGTYLVVSAQITVTKSSTVISDPSGGANPKRVPGAVVEYTIAVANSGAAAADSIVLTDTLDADTTFVASSISVDGVAEDDNNTDADESDPNGANHNAGVVTATIATVPAAGSKNVVFRVTID